MYAFSYAAIYGRPFFESASNAMQLMKSRGLDAIINDSLIGNVLVVGQLFTGCLCAAVAPLAAVYLFKSSGDWRMWIIIGLVLGIVVSGAVLCLIESGVVTLFVCLADDPSALRATKPDVHDKLVPKLQGMEGVDLRSMGGGGAHV